MLAPLTELVGECGQTKVIKAKGTKKVPWHWDEVHQRRLQGDNEKSSEQSKRTQLLFLLRCG